MSGFEWDSALETGNAEIDAQHRTLFRLADELQRECVGSCVDAGRVADAVYELADYIVEHFADEEAYMMRNGYPDFSSHREQHRRFSERAVRVAASYFNGEDVPPEGLSRLVVEWLTGHILDEDVRMIRFVSGHA